jgi:osmotically-inducible protein OsmY
MTQQFYSQYSDDLRRTRYDEDDLDHDLDRRHQGRGIRQARPGQAWYNEPHRQRQREAEDLEGRASYTRRFERDTAHSRNRTLQNQGRQTQARQRGQVWWTPGPYQGLGPRGYRRTDRNIKEDVCGFLTRHGKIDAREIEVDVQSGEVTLTGSVAGRREKRLAEDLAESVSGVLDVQNRLRLSKERR